MKRVKLIGAFVLAAGILFQASDAVAGAQRAMRIWISGVAPALFPFLVLMPLLTGFDACAAYGALFGKVMQPLFRLPGQAAPAVVISMIAGSPGGAVAAARVADQSRMKIGEARRIALGAAGVSPAFLISAVGRGMYGSAAVGASLAAVQMGNQLLLLFLLRFFFDEEEETVSTHAAQTCKNPIQCAVEQVLSICGYMVFFSSVGAVVRGILGEKLGRFALLLLDLPSGLAELANWNFPASRFALGAAVGCGGVCIGMQNVDALHAIDLPAGIYAAVRTISAVIMGTACMWILPGESGRGVESMQNPRIAFAFSILIAVILALPAMIYLSEKYFLNKNKNTKMRSKNEMEHNIQRCDKNIEYNI